MKFKVLMVKLNPDYDIIEQNNEMKEWDLSDNLVEYPIMEEPLDESLGRCKFSLLLDSDKELFNKSKMTDVPNLNTSIDPYTRFFVEVTDDYGNVKENDYLLEFDSVEKFILDDSDDSTCQFLHHINLIDCSAAAQAILVPDNSFTWRLQDTNLKYYGAYPENSSAWSSYKKEVFGRGARYYASYTLLKWKNLQEVHEEYGAEITVVDKSSTINILNPIVVPPDASKHTVRINIPQFQMTLSDYHVDYHLSGLVNQYFGQMDTGFENIPMSTITFIYVIDGDKTTAIDPIIQNIPTSFSNLLPDFNKKRYTSTSTHAGLDSSSHSKPNGLLDSDLNLFRPIFENNNNEKYFDLIVYDSSKGIDYRDKKIKMVTKLNLVEYEYDYYNKNVFDADYVKSKKTDGVYHLFYRYFSSAWGVEPYSKSHLVNIKENHFFFPESVIELDIRQSIKRTNVMYRSASPYNILDILTKLQVSSNQFSANNFTDMKSLSENMPFIWKGDMQSNSPMYLASQTTVPEINFTNKSLWDCLIQLCYFMGAIPHIHAQRNKSQFVIMLKKLGTSNETKYSNVTSIFNSRNMSEAVTEIKNLYQNVYNSSGSLTEYVYPMSEDGSLVSLDNAKICTSYKIDKILSFGFYTDPDRMQNYVDATPWIVEESIYSQFNSIYEKYGGTIPNKGMVIYYKNGTNIIAGLSYVSPNKNTAEFNETNSAAIKYVINSAIHSKKSDPYEYNPFEEHKDELNALDITKCIFVITYVPIANVHASMLRTDLRKYFLNTNYNSYPTYQQRDQVSEYNIEGYKLGANIAGKLMRIGNEIYQISDWGNDNSKLHNVGEIYKLDNIYYINKITTMFFADHYESKVELSKDFNRLCQYIGLDSQSRFYEIPNQKVNRAVNVNILMDIHTLEDKSVKFGTGINPLPKMEGRQSLVDIILRKESATYFNYAEICLSTEESKTFVGLLPIVSNTIGRTLSLQFETYDNFKFGDAYLRSSYNNKNSSKVMRMTTVNADGKLVDTPTKVRSLNDGEGNSFYLQPSQCKMTDQYGRIKSYSINILKNYCMNKNNEERRIDDAFTLPSETFALIGVGIQNEAISINIGKHNKPIEEMIQLEIPNMLLLKDAGEKLTFCVNIQPITSSDRFNISKYIWQIVDYSSYDPKRVKKASRFVALSYEINKLDDSPIPLETQEKDYIYISSENSLIDESSENSKFNVLEAFKMLTEEQVKKTKCIALVDMNTNIPLIYRNVDGLDMDFRLNEDKENSINFPERESKFSDWLFRFSL